jgi:hypothetical protein
MQILLRLQIIGILAIAITIGTYGQTGPASSPSCRDWFSKIDPHETPQASFTLDKLTDVEKVKGMVCLLKLEGRKNDARFSGATRPNVSQLFPATSVEVGALYYVSYVFTGKWDHGSACYLRGVDGRINDPQDIREAYRLYRKWIEQVEKIGLAAAREKRMSPLEGSSTSWY